MVKPIANGVPIPTDAMLARTATYPHVIVRIYSTVYEREHIDVRIGAPAIDIRARGTYVQHPQPFDTDGTLSMAGRTLLIAGVQNAVRRLKFRMCIVWTPASSTYVEINSIINASGHPVGGWSLPSPIQFDKRK